MNGDVNLVTIKGLIQSVNKEISERTGIPLEKVAKMSPLETDRVLGVTKPDIDGTIGEVNARIQKDREWVERNLRKVLSEYYRERYRERAKDYYR